LFLFVGSKIWVMQKVELVRNRWHWLNNKLMVVASTKQRLVISGRFHTTIL
jgi:hypothetical protein